MMAHFFNRPYKVKQPISFKHFTNTKKIGQGAFASVFRANDPSRGYQVVALKKIDLSAITDEVTMKTTLSEIELFKMLRHENIVQCYGSFSEGKRANRGDNRQYLTLILEFIDGGDLEHWIACKTRPLQYLIVECEIWHVFYQIANAVEYIHRSRIIHRDLKPANILLTRDLHVKLTDFGLSRMHNRNTGPKTVCGTPYYMAPERIGEVVYSFSSDIWSLGCILYEMVALNSPFHGEKENITSLVKKIEDADYPPIAEECYSEQMGMLIDACMMPHFADRPNARTVKALAALMHRRSFPKWY